MFYLTVGMDLAKVGKMLKLIQVEIGQKLHEKPSFFTSRPRKNGGFVVIPRWNFRVRPSLTTLNLITKMPNLLLIAIGFFETYRIVGGHLLPWLLYGAKIISSFGEFPIAPPGWRKFVF